MKSTSRPSFLSGVSILTLSALLVKVIGLFYRIPMLGILGTEGMGYFNTAYELYALFCVLAKDTPAIHMSDLVIALILINFSVIAMSTLAVVFATRLDSVANLTLCSFIFFAGLQQWRPPARRTASWGSPRRAS